MKESVVLIISASNMGMDQANRCSSRSNHWILPHKDSVRKSEAFHPRTHKDFRPRILQETHAVLSQGLFRPCHGIRAYAQGSFTGTQGLCSRILRGPCLRTREGKNLCSLILQMNSEGSIGVTRKISMGLFKVIQGQGPL